MNETERQAHRYADNGWPVFPAAPDSKLPLTQHGFLDASSSHRRIETWWGSHPQANVAIATGRPGPDVLDIDVHKSGSGWAALNELKRAGLVPEPGAVVRTPSTGAHFYYAGSDQRNGHLPDQHLDYRGLGGYVVAPPSQVDGRPYAVVKHQPVAASFDWQAARQHLSPQPKPSPSLNAQKSLPGGARDVRHLVPWLESQPATEGNRNEALFWAANRAVEADDNATLGQLAKAAESLGLSRREVDRTIASAQRPKVPSRGPGIEHQGQREAKAEASAEVRDRPFVPEPSPARDEPEKERGNAMASSKDPEAGAWVAGDPEREQALADMGPDGVPLTDYQAEMDRMDAALDASRSEPEKEREAEAG